MTRGAATQAPTTVSVDVWDTLLRRRCAPDGTKLFTCLSLCVLAGRQLKPWYRDSWSLLALRCRIERRLARANRRQGGDGEYRIADVLAALVACAIRSVDPAERWPERLLAIEIAQERYVSYADPDITRVLDETNGAQRLFISDFYMPMHTVAELLAVHGFPALATDGFVSADVGLNKRSGRLFAHIAHTRDLKPGSWLHIGDNEVADIRAPTALGLQTHLYRPGDAHNKRTSLEQAFSWPHLAVRNALATARATTTNEREFHVAHALAGFALYVCERFSSKSQRALCTGPVAPLLADIFGALDRVYGDVWPCPSRVVVSDLDAASFDPSRSSDVLVAVASDQPGAYTVRDFVGRDWNSGDEQRQLAGSGVASIAECLMRDWRTHALRSCDVAPAARVAWRAACGGGAVSWNKPSLLLITPHMTRAADRLHALTGRLIGIAANR